MHDVIHHISHAAFLNCWQLEAGQQNTNYKTLELFAESEPAFETLQEMA
jgi:hypothetical protein